MNAVHTLAADLMAFPGTSDKEIRRMGSAAVLTILGAPGKM